MTSLSFCRVIYLLGAVDDQLSDGPPIHILVGDGVGMMRHNRHRLTVDVDVFNYRIPDELQQAAAQVALSADLPGDWLNNDVRVCDRHLRAHTDGQSGVSPAWWAPRRARSILSC